MTIEQAVNIYNTKKDRITKLNNLIKRIVERDYFERLSNEYVVNRSEFEEIAIFLKELEERLQADLQANFK